MNNPCFFNDSFSDLKQVGLPLKDLAIMRGYGIFDFFRTYQQRLFKPELYLKRLRKSAAQMRFEIKYSDSEIIDIARELVKKTSYRNTGLRIFITGGAERRGSGFENSNFFVTTEEVPLPSAEQQAKGIALGSYPFQRELPHIKSINYLTSIYLEPQMEERKIDDVLYFNEQSISECPRSNVFFIFGEKLVTPKEKVLEGITRQLILEIARTHFEVEVRDISISEAKQADEIFVTSTSREVLGVRKLDEVELSGNSVGLKTKKLSSLFEELIQSQH